MKKLIIPILLLIVCIVLIPKTLSQVPTQEPEEPKETTIIGELSAIENVIGNAENPQEALKFYLLEWAKENNLKGSKDKYGNVLIEKVAEDGFEDLPVTILHGNNKNIASALYVVKMSETKAGIKVLYTLKKEDDMTGAENVNPLWLAGDQLISLGNSQEASMVNSSAGMETLSFAQTMVWVKPLNTKAFEVSLRNFNGGSAHSEENLQNANPIKICGDLLAYAKNNGIVLELASFNAGVTPGFIPQDATFVVVVNEYDSKGFQKVYQEALDKFKKAYKDIEKDATFEIRPVELPDKVLVKESSSNIISYLYGMVDGVFTLSPEEKNKVESSSTLSTAYTYTGNFTGSLSMLSTSPGALAQIQDAHQKVCYLSEIEYAAENTCPAWEKNTDSKLFPLMMEYQRELLGHKINTSPLYRPLECSFFVQKNPDLDMIYLAVDKQEELILYLLGDRSLEEEED